MPPKTEDRLRDILDAIDDIERLIADRNKTQFAGDKLLRLAAERCLEIICEASRHLPDDLKQSAPAIDWRKMIDFGNLLRHAYHATDVDIVWTIIVENLPPLKAFAKNAISMSQS